jgi:hypothetical protein
MRFPFRDFWSRLIGKFGDFTYFTGLKIRSNWRLPIESENNKKAKGLAALCRESSPFVFTSYRISFT